MTFRSQTVERLAACPPISSNLSISIDILRFLSAQLVFWGHIGSFLGGEEFFIGGKWRIQNLGVVVFFMLSGFLIIRTLAKYRDFGSFFVDRFVRIYLTFIPCLIIVTAIDSIMVRQGGWIYEESINAATFLANLLMLQDFPLFKQISGFGFTSFGSARPLWTLAVEWWLYMFAGWVFLGVRFRKTWLILLSCVPIAFATFGRGNALSLVWILGGLLVFIPENKLERRTALAGSIVCLVLFGIRVAYTQSFYDFQACVFLAAFFAIILDEVRRSSFFSILSDRSVGLVRILAGSSYALYILHYTIIEVVRSRGWDHPQTILISFLASNALAIVVYLLFDKNHRILAANTKKILGLTGSRPPVK